MKKRLVLLLVLIVGLLALVVPTVVFAHQQNVQSTVFYACENNQGGIDPNSITQNDGILQSGSCIGSNVVVQWSVTGPQGIQGIKGNIGPAGLQGPQGDIGANGSNVLTSDNAPTGGCTSGDSDIDLSTDEVYSCAASTWVDTNHTLKGDPGIPGLKGDTGPTGPAGIPFSHAACSEKLSGSAQQENRIFCQSGIEVDGGLVYTAAINAAKVRILVGTPISTFPNVDWGGVAVTYVEFTSGFHMEYHADNVVRVYNTLNQRVF